MRTHVKICGITDRISALTATGAGADAIGFVFADSPRQLSTDTALSIISELPEGTVRVAVFLRPSGGIVAKVLDRFPADIIQADHDAPIVGGVPFLPVFREGSSDPAQVAAWLAAHPQSRFVYEGPRSGVGTPVDWDNARRLSRLGLMTLAGGLRPDNVAEAIHVVRPFGVDVSSGVESAPGVKDPALITDFIEAVRTAEVQEEK